MIRIKSSYLHKKNNLFLLNEKPFSGLSYNAENSLIKEISFFELGVKKNEYSDSFLEKDNSTIEVDEDFLDEEIEGIYESKKIYNDSFFSGISYEFENSGICTSEKLYKKGEIKKQKSYYLDGNIEYIEINNENHYEYYNWHENNNIKKIEIINKNNENNKIEKNENSITKSITLNFENETIKNYLKIPNNNNILLNEKYNESLLLSGKKIDGPSIDLLIENKKFIKVNHLILSHTNINHESIKKIIKKTEIKKIEILTNNNLDKKLLQKIKEEKEIIINEESI